MPGAQRTRVFRTGLLLEDTKLGASKEDDLALVAKQGFKALMAGKTKVNAGSLESKAPGKVIKVLPDKAKTVFHRKETEPDRRRMKALTWHRQARRSGRSGARPDPQGAERRHHQGHFEWHLRL